MRKIELNSVRIIDLCLLTLCAACVFRWSTSGSATLYFLSQLACALAAGACSDSCLKSKSSGRFWAILVSGLIGLTWIVVDLGHAVRANRETGAPVFEDGLVAMLIGIPVLMCVYGAIAATIGTLGGTVGYRVKRAMIRENPTHSLTSRVK